MTLEETNQIKLTLENIFLQIKDGGLSGGWQVYDEFERQLKSLMQNNEESEQQGDRFKSLIIQDSSYNYVSPLSNTALGKALYSLFNGKSQTKEREAYENGAKIYYDLGFKDGQKCCDKVYNNIDKDTYDFLMRLLALLGVKFTYIIDLPAEIKDIVDRVPYHTGLNLIRAEDCHLSEKDLENLKNIINNI